MTKIYVIEPVDESSRSGLKYQDLGGTIEDSGESDETRIWQRSLLGALWALWAMYLYWDYRINVRSYSMNACRTLLIEYRLGLD